MKIIAFTEVDSTNAEARRLSERGERGPLWLQADSQSAGRGRRGRSWTSKPGNLYASGLFPYHGEPQILALMSFAAALAVADTLSRYVAEDIIKLKWPNDVLLGGRKTSGILLESLEGGFIVGIGVNVLHHPTGTEFPATHLMAHMNDDDLSGPEPLMSGVPAMIAILTARFEHWRGMLETQGFEPLRKAWMSRAYNIPGPVYVRLPNENFTGTALGLDANGTLRVRIVDDTIRSISAGDVFFNTLPENGGLNVTRD